MAQVLYQLLHLPKVWQDEEGYGIPYIVLYQHPAGQTVILAQVKFTQAVDHGHKTHQACIQLELSFRNILSMNVCGLEPWGEGRGYQKSGGIKI